MIYLVDDQENFLDVVKSEYGDRIRTFNHPNDAFKALLSERPTVLITDIFMPMRINEGIPPQGMDGLTLAELVHSTMPEITIVVVSGNERSEIEKKFPGKLAKFHFFFNKPLGDDFHELVKKLESEHRFTEVSVRLKPSEVEQLKDAEGDSLPEKVLYAVKHYRGKRRNN